MSKAECFVILYQSGSKSQAERLSKSWSIAEIQDWENEATVFVFEDGSAVYMSGSEFRVATQSEAE